MSQVPGRLFDTRGEFARDLPLELIAAWRLGDRTAEAAQRLLEPYRLTGTVVVSDSAGLTKLSMNRDPLEVAAMISRPKELLHQFGTVIGGVGIGVWNADNTEMFYPETVDCAEIASMLIALQKRLADECEVRIGIAAHHGSFFLIGTDLYGPEADAAECLAEDRTSGGETVLTEAFLERLPANAGFETQNRNDGFRLLEAPPFGRDVSTGSPLYPFPFSEEFFRSMTRFYRDRDLDRFRAEVRARFAQRCSILLIERESVPAPAADSRILEDMAAAAIARTLGEYLLAATSGEEVKTAGALSIYTFPDAAEAWRFASDLRDALVRENIRSRSGIATGEVMIFDLPDGNREICGVPVNLASKVAQDCGEFGCIYLVNEELAPASRTTGLKQLAFTIAGMQVAAWCG